MAANPKLSCFLSTSSGDISLRHLFKEKVSLNELKQGILNYTKIQRTLENKTQQLQKIGALDWRLNQFALLYSNLLQKESLLKEDGLTKQEIDLLYKLYPACIKLCNDLSEYILPETISHCDFHENNMILDRKTGTIHIIDWGEIVITHPFMSLNGCLWNINYFHKISEADINKLKVHCVNPWLNYHGINDLLDALNLANQLNGIYAALAYEQMYLATQDTSNSIQKTHKGSIAGCLRTFYIACD